MTPRRVLTGAALWETRLMLHEGSVWSAARLFTFERYILYVMTAVQGSLSVLLHIITSAR